MLPTFGDKTPPTYLFLSIDLKLTVESPLLDFPETVPFFPVVEARTPEFTLLEPPAFAGRPVVLVLVEPRAHAPSCGDFLIPP